VREKFAILAAAVYLIRKIGERTQVLLHMRSGDIRGAGTWEASAAGHADPDEPLTVTAQREAMEEIGITFDPKDIVFTTCVYGKHNGFRMHAHFFIDKWQGTPTIIEVDKAKNLTWFDMDELPENFFGDRGMALDNFKKGVVYSEYGW